MSREKKRTFVKRVARAPVRHAEAVVQDTRELLHKSGHLDPRKAMVSTAIALSLGFLCLLAVVAFHFPQYLTTPDLRHKYDVDVLRQILLGCLLIAGGLSLANVIFGRRRNLNVAAFVMVLAAVALGGSRVPVGTFPDHTPYIGLDWFILDLLGSTLLFVVIEKLFPLYRGQSVFRFEWQTDMKHFAVNHFMRPCAAGGEFSHPSRFRLAGKQRLPAHYRRHPFRAAAVAVHPRG